MSQELTEMQSLGLDMVYLCKRRSQQSASERLDADNNVFRQQLDKCKHRAYTPQKL